MSLLLSWEWVSQAWEISRGTQDSLFWVTESTQSRIKPQMCCFYNTEIHFQRIVFIKALNEKILHARGLVTNVDLQL